MQDKRANHQRRGMVFLTTIVLTVLVLFQGACSRQGSSTPPVSQETVSPSETAVQAKQFKVLHIMSYSADWKWSEDQFTGFQDALSGLDVEYKVLEMDMKRQNSEDWIAEISQRARDLIDTWKPDLVFTSDDDVQEHVVQHYVDSDIPFVFSGVNAAPETYGFAGSTNVTGVLEQEHFVQTMRLLQQLVPGVTKIAVVVDDSPMWPPVLERMKAKQDQLPEIEFISWDTILTFEEYKQKMLAYQDSVDAVGLIGIFHFKDENGENVPYQDVLRWTAENSNLPDFTYWADRISYGTLCTVTVSGYAQGLAAGKIARGILMDGKRTADYAIAPTVKGEPMISLARANKLGLSISSDILLSAQVVKEFEWEK